MRIIPKNTKIKLQFYKGVTITDIILAVVSLGFFFVATHTNIKSANVFLVIVFIIYDNIWFENFSINISLFKNFIINLFFIKNKTL